MWIWKRVKHLEADNDLLHKRLCALRRDSDNFDRRMVKLELSVRDLEDRASKLELDNAMGENALHAVEAAAAALAQRLDELEPELEQYKLGVEEAAAYERSMNDGMASIFGYTAPSMRGAENGGR